MKARTFFIISFVQYSQFFLFCMIIWCMEGATQCILICTQKARAQKSIATLTLDGLIEDLKEEVLLAQHLERAAGIVNHEELMDLVRRHLVQHFLRERKERKKERQ